MTLHRYACQISILYVPTKQLNLYLYIVYQSISRTRYNFKDIDLLQYFKRIKRPNDRIAILPNVQDSHDLESIHFVRDIYQI